MLKLGKKYYPCPLNSKGIVKRWFGKDVLKTKKVTKSHIKIVDNIFLWVYSILGLNTVN